MDLWTEFDKHQQSPGATGSTHATRSRRLTEHTILSSLRDWLLHDYAATYCRSLAVTRIFRHCYWIDALGVDAKSDTITVADTPSPASDSTSNTRKKSAGRIVQNTSPLLQPIISLSQLLTQESKPIVLNGLILAAGSSKRKDAKQNGATPTPKPLIVPKESSIVRASWLEAAPTLLKEIEHSPAIFLLNPCGPTMFRYDDLALLYQRTVPTELCLLIPHKQLETRLLAAHQTPAQATLLTGLLRTDRWKTLPTGEEELAQALNGLVDFLVASMQRYFSLPVQRIALLMQVHPATVEEVAYTLIFATRRQDSIASMNDAVCTYRRRVYTQSLHGVLGEEWFAKQEQQHLSVELQQLYQRTLQQGRTQRTRRWPDLRQQLLLANFGRFTTQDYNTIVQQLIINGEIRCEWRQRNVETGGERVPANEDTLLWR